MSSAFFRMCIADLQNMRKKLSKQKNTSVIFIYKYMTNQITLMILSTVITIQDIIKAYKMEGAMFFLGVIMFSLFKTKFVKDMLTKFFDNVLHKIKGGQRKTVSELSLNATEDDILHHDIFSYMDFWIYSNIPSMVFFTDFRTNVFKKYLTIFFTTYKTELKKYVEQGEYKKMNKPELKQSLLKLLTNIVNNYEVEMKNIGIPLVVINKMKNKNNETLNLIIELINSICDSHFYDTEDNLLKMFSFMNIISAVLDNIVSSAEQVCNSINGELKGLVMDGATEPSKY